MCKIGDFSFRHMYALTHTKLLRFRKLFRERRSEALLRFTLWQPACQPVQMYRCGRQLGRRRLRRGFGRGEAFGGGNRYLNLGFVLILACISSAISSASSTSSSGDRGADERLRQLHQLLDRRIYSELYSLALVIAPVIAFLAIRKLLRYLPDNPSQESRDS